MCMLINRSLSMVQGCTQCAQWVERLSLLPLRN